MYACVKVDGGACSWPRRQNRGVRASTALLHPCQGWLLDTESEGCQAATCWCRWMGGAAAGHAARTEGSGLQQPCCTFVWAALADPHGPPKTHMPQTSMWVGCTERGAL